MTRRLSLVRLFGNTGTLPKSERNPDGRRLLHYFVRPITPGGVTSTYCGLSDTLAQASEKRHSWCLECSRIKAAYRDTLVSDLAYYEWLQQVPYVEHELETLFASYPKNVYVIEFEPSPKWKFKNFLRDFEFNASDVRGKEFYFLHKRVQAHGNATLLPRETTVCGMVIWDRYLKQHSLMPHEAHNFGHRTCDDVRIAQTCITFLDLERERYLPLLPVWEEAKDWFFAAWPVKKVFEAQMSHFFYDLKGLSLFLHTFEPQQFQDLRETLFAPDVYLSTLHMPAQGSLDDLLNTTLSVRGYFPQVRAQSTRPESQALLDDSR